MSRRFIYSAILVVALRLIAAAGFLYARGTGGYESATVHKSISHEAAPPTIDPRVARQMRRVKSTSFGGEKAWKASQGCGLTMTRGK